MRERENKRARIKDRDAQKKAASVLPRLEACGGTETEDSGQCCDNRMNGEREGRLADGCDPVCGAR